MDLSKYSHLIWDWNGTLLDDAWLCVDIINEFLTQRSLAAISLHDYRSIFTFPVRDYYVALGFDFNRESWERISNEFISNYEQKRVLCRLMPDAARVLDHVSSLGITQSILSASRQDYLEQAVNEYGLDGYFSSLNGLNNHHAAGKVEIGVAFVASNHLDPSEILFVGDTLHDAQVAAAMGTDCCLVPNGHQTRERLSAFNGWIIGSLAEIC